MSTKTSKAHYDQLISALQALASACDGAVDRDGVGFNGTDSRFGRSIAEDSYTRQLSPTVQTIAIKMVQKYRKQLMGYGVVNLPTQVEYGDGYGNAADPAPKAKERKPETVIRGQDGVIHVKFNHNITSNKDRLKDGLMWTDRRWHGATKEWIVQPRAAADLLALFPHAEVGSELADCLFMLVTTMGKDAALEPMEWMIFDGDLTLDDITFLVSDAARAVIKSGRLFRVPIAISGIIAYLWNQGWHLPAAMVGKRLARIEARLNGQEKRKRAI